MNVLSAILSGSAAKCASKMATTPKRAKENRENEEENASGQFDKWKRNIAKLIDFVDSREFPDMQLQEDADLFRTFLEFVLVHFVSCTTWRYKCYNTPVSQIFTVSDEALAMLLLENSMQDLKWVVRRGQKIPHNISMPKYTKKMEGSSEKFKGWHKSGIKRYNKLYQRILTNRVRKESLEKEDLIQDEFVKISGRDRRGATVNMLDDSDDDSTSDFEPIDGFIGEDRDQMGGDNNNAICLDDNDDDETTAVETNAETMDGVCGV